MTRENRRTYRASGRALRSLRLARNLTREALAARSGVGKRIIDAIEAGNHACFPKTIDALAIALSVPPDALLHRTRFEVTCLPAIDDIFVGRDEEIARIDEASRAGGAAFVVVRGPAGIGKSTLVARWFHALSLRDYDDAEVILWWSFGLGDATPVARCDQFITSALQLFGDEAPSEGMSYERAARLVAHIEKKRVVLVLDQIENIVSPFHGGFIHPTARSILQQLHHTMNGLCVLLARPPFQWPFGEGAAPATRPVVHLELSPLTPEQGANLLTRLGARGTEDELLAAARQHHGNPLALRLLGAYVSKALEGKMALHDRTTPLDDRYTEVNLTRLLDSYLELMSGGLLRDILAIACLTDFSIPTGVLSLFRRCEVLEGINEALVATDSREISLAIQALARAGLVHESSSGGIDLPPLIRAAARRRFASIDARSVARAHDLLASYLARLFHGPSSTLEEHRTLHAAIRHRCLAGKPFAAWSELYFPRLQQGKPFSALFLEGLLHEHLATLKQFFRVPFREAHEELPAIPSLTLKFISSLVLNRLGRLDDALVAADAARVDAIAMEASTYAAFISIFVVHIMSISGNGQFVDREIAYTLEFTQRCGILSFHRAACFRCAHALWERGQGERARELFAKGQALAGEARRFEDLGMAAVLDAATWCLCLDFLREEGLEGAETAGLHIEAICAGYDLAPCRGLVHLVRAMRTRDEVAAEVDAAVQCLRGVYLRDFLLVALRQRALLLAGTNPARAIADTREALVLSVDAGLKIHECDARSLLLRLDPSASDADEHRAAILRIRRATGYTLQRRGISR